MAPGSWPASHGAVQSRGVHEVKAAGLLGSCRRGCHSRRGSQPMGLGPEGPQERLRSSPSGDLRCPSGDQPPDRVFLGMPTGTGPPVCKPPLGEPPVYEPQVCEPPVAAARRVEQESPLRTTTLQTPASGSPGPWDRLQGRSPPKRAGRQDRRCRSSGKAGRRARGRAVRRATPQETWPEGDRPERCACPGGQRTQLRPQLFALRQRWRLGGNDSASPVASRRGAHAAEHAAGCSSGPRPRSHSDAARAAALEATPATATGEPTSGPARPPVTSTRRCRSSDCRRPRPGPWKGSAPAARHQSPEAPLPP
mmetsp:Transcript_53404/g.115409  ORF Transcript_53404/g.115409 Transcript_53404/m.115409 type:complete len:309 (+) Transcript_53404:136-1062(+)